MKDHQFSNQKSALEAYFESLLTEDDNDAIAVAEKPVADAEKNNEQVKNTTVIEVQSNDQDVVNEPEKTPVDIPDKLEPDFKKPEPRRSSVEEMLATVEQKAEQKPESKLDFAEPQPVLEIPLPDVAPPDVVTETETETVVEVKVETELTTTDELEQQLAPELATEQAVAPAAGDMPEWAEQPFQCLLFNVGGLSLAVPLVRLNGVIPWTDKVVETPNQTDWYLGVLMNHGNKVQVIDTAVMVLPPEHRADLPEEPDERFSHILLVDEQRWGLACDSIGDVVWIKKDDVKWRSNKTKRPWLLGTAIDHMCAVMDTEAFADMLEVKK